MALVSLMAPAAVLGGTSRAGMASGWLAKALAKVPSAFFEANIPVRQSGFTLFIFVNLCMCMCPKNEHSSNVCA